MYRNAVGEPSHGDRQRAQKLVKFGRAVFGRPADRTIGRAFGTLCRLSVVCNVLYCGETVRPSEKLSEGVNRKPVSQAERLQRRCTKHASLISTTANIASELSGPSWITRSLLQLCVSGVDVFQLV